MALTLPALTRDQLPKHAVPATVALVGGIVLDLDPRAAPAITESLTRKTP